jgi:hypothetical protein
MPEPEMHSWPLASSGGPMPRPCPDRLQTGAAAAIWRYGEMAIWRDGKLAIWQYGCRSTRCSHGDTSSGLCDETSKQLDEHWTDVACVELRRCSTQERRRLCDKLWTDSNSTNDEPPLPGHASPADAPPPLMLCSAARPCTERDAFIG